MAYEDLLKSVEESAGEKERELRTRAEAAVAEIRARAKIQADAVREGHREVAEKSILAERNKLLYLTRAENKELLIKIRETAFESAFREAEARLSGIRSAPEYPAIFEKLLREAASAMGDDVFAIHVDRRDEALCRRILPAISPSSEVRTDIETAGGVVAGLPDNSVVLSNTVESRLLRAREHKRKEIHVILSGE